MDKLLYFEAPEQCDKITVLDAHAGGEPLRIIIDGLPEIKGENILEKRRFFKDNFDHIRTQLMWEPRGHADMYGCILTEPVTPGADFGVFFMHNEGYSTMCGHAILALTKVVLQAGMIDRKAPVTSIKIDTPAGLVKAYAEIGSGHVKQTWFRNVPAFVQSVDQVIHLEGIGEVKYDIAFGGAFYAIVEAKSAHVECHGADFRALIETGKRLKAAIAEATPVKHPFDEDLSFLYGVIFTCPPENAENHSRNVCVFADGEVDRSPTGTGVSARLALHYAKGEIAIDEAICIESIIGSEFIGKIVAETTFGPHNAIIPEVRGSAYVTGKTEFWIDPTDRLQNGFLLR
jgi:proline racemase